MAVSAQSKAMDEVQQALNGFLQEQGFRKRARTYSRKTADGLTQVLNFQMGRFEPPGSTAGMRPISSFYGQFTVNLGIFIPEVSAALRPWAGKTITEPLCELRVRLGALVYPFGDRWWPAGANAYILLAQKRENSPTLVGLLPARQKKRRTDRFMDIICRAQAEAVGFIFDLDLGGEKKHRDIAGFLVIFEAATDLKPVNIRHHYIQQDQIG